jgi:hypothetical protein
VLGLVDVRFLPFVAGIGVEPWLTVACLQPSYFILECGDLQLRPLYAMVYKYCVLPCGFGVRIVWLKE